MIALLSQLAFAADTVMAMVEEAGTRSIDAATHVGFDISGPRPGVTGRVDIGQRIAVDGSLFGDIPIAEGMKWTGGASLGMSVAPVKVTFGSRGAVDLRIGAGGQAKTTAGVKVSVGGLDWSAWTSATLSVTPDGRWTMYGGVLAEDLDSAPRLVPTTGVRVRLD